MILVVDKSKRNAATFADMFFYMGVLAKSATIAESFSEISNFYRAIVVMDPDEIADVTDYVHRMRAYSAAIPIFALGDKDAPKAELFDCIFPKEACASEILSKILEYTYERDIPQPGDYKLAGMDLSCDMSTPTYFWTPFPLTKTEAMIVKFLVRAYPNPVSAEDILRYAYRESKYPEVSIIRTHISIINKKFRNLSNRNLIEMTFGTGYRILTPEVASALV